MIKPQNFTTSFCLAETINLPGTRLDRVLTDYLESREDTESLTRSRISKIIAEGFVLVNGRVSTKASLAIKETDWIEITVPELEPLSLIAEPEVKLNIIWEDPDLIVLNKPVGMVVHPGAGNPSGTLVNGLLAHLGAQQLEVGDKLRPGIVHRLDKDTSGLMIVAKTVLSYRKLQEQFLPPRKVSRKYLALCRKTPGNSDSGKIDLPLGRDANNRVKIAVREDGKQAITHWQIKQKLLHGVLLELKLETGRTHQIRSHLAHMGAAIVGDPLYGDPSGSFPSVLQKTVAAFNRQALHAAELSFLHPSSVKKMNFSVEPDPNMSSLIKRFND